jgi:outer membrane protein assembly factor BamA
LIRLCEVVFYAVLILVCSVTHASANPVPADQQITVVHFAIEGADNLSASQIEEVKAAVMGRPESSEALMDTARHMLTADLNRKCYIRSDIDLDVVNAQATPQSAWMHIKVRQGVRYRLSNFRIEWAHAFTAAQIGELLPLDAMRRGDCSSLDDVESTVTDFYRSRGFRNVKVNRLVQADKATEQFNLTLYIDEGK